MSGLCAYSHALGVPGQGSHSWRVGGLAGVDLLLTAGIAAVATKYMATSNLGTFLKIFAVLIVIAVGVHELFCVRTRLNAWLFNRPWPDPADTQAKLNPPAVPPAIPPAVPPAQ